MILVSPSCSKMPEKEEEVVWSVHEGSFIVFEERLVE